MRVLFWFCDSFAWAPAVKALPEADLAESGEETASVVAFIHVEPQDMQHNSTAETKLVKNAKWLARKWQTKTILLHAFNHLGERKTEPAKPDFDVNIKQEMDLKKMACMAHASQMHFSEVGPITTILLLLPREYWTRIDRTTPVL